MASGTPLIASLPLDGGDAPRIVKESEAGILVKAGDVEAFTQAVLKLRNDPELSSRLGKNGRKYAQETFSLSKCTQRYEDLFSSLKG
jgi:colanic acid biosynthesis glycosyl transferase WcaI